ncbi:unnamed protein product [Rotaria socialis]
MKDTLTMGTWNVQTLWVTGKLELLRNEIKRFRFDVIGISEVRWTGKGEISGGGFILPGEDTTHNRGVGMLLSARAKHTLIGYNPISSRVITARFHTTPFKLTVIQVYAPTPASLDDEIELFYDSIEHALTQTPKKDIVIVTGDWNAKFGSENTNWELVMGKYGYSDRNERGDRLTEFAALHSLYICNTRFQQKVNRNQTSPDGVDNNMIDLVLIQMRWKSSVTNFRTFQSADISSDHFLVLYNIKLRLKRRCIKPQQNRRPNVNQLNKNQKTREAYQARLDSRLQDIDSDYNLEEHPAKVEDAIKEALQATVATTKRAKKPWVSEQTLDLADANYRTISLINHTGKILLTVLLNRLKRYLGPYLSEEQAGFRQDRSTVH